MYRTLINTQYSKRGTIFSGLKAIRFSIFLICFFALISCNKQSSFSVAILHTNDVHGELKNMAKVSALKKELEEKYDYVLLLSAGDMFSGNPYIDFHDEKGFPMIDIMNKIGYDLAVLGNHEFDYGQEILTSRLEQANFPFLCYNIDAGNTGLSKFFIKQKHFVFNDISLNFRGFIETTNNGLPSSHPSKLKGLKFLPYTEFLDSLSVSTNGEYVFLLNHLGYKSDSIMATKLPNISAIIGGHSHSLIDSTLLINNVLVTQSGDDLENIGLITLTFNNGNLEDRQATVISLDSYKKEDEAIAKLIKSYLSNPDLDSTICTSVNTLARNDMGCLMTDAQLANHKADFAFQNYYGIRIDSIPSGSINNGVIYEMDPFNNELLIFSLKYEDIKELISYSYNLRMEMDLFISGGTYQLFIDKNKTIKNIKIFDISGLELSDKQVYKVALNSYVGSSYKFGDNLDFVPTGTNTANNIIEYLEKTKVIDYNGCTRAQLINLK